MCDGILHSSDIMRLDALISRKDGSLIEHEDILVFDLGNFEFNEHLVIHFENFEFEV